jgi:hypothetical protein
MPLPEPDAQTIWSGLLSLAIFATGWLLKAMRESIGALHAEDKAIAEKVQHIEVLVAGDYVKKSDLDRDIQRIFEKLDQIESKLDRKVNRDECRELLS